MHSVPTEELPANSKAHEQAASRMNEYLVQTGDIAEIETPPASKIGSQRQVHVLDSGPAIPASDIHDGADTPHSSRAVKVEEAARSIVSILLTLAVIVQGNLLRLQHNVAV